MVSLRELVATRIKRELEIKHDAHVSFAEMLTPAFVGGIIIGIVLGVPGLNLLIPLVAYGGYYAVSLVKDYYDKYITEGGALKVGAFAGFIGAFIGTAIMLIVAVFFGDSTAILFRDFLDYKTADVLLTLSGLDPYLSITTLKLRFVANLAIGIGLGAIGGGYYIKKVKEREVERERY